MEHFSYESEWANTYIVIRLKEGLASGFHKNLGLKYLTSYYLKSFISKTLKYKTQWHYIINYVA